MSLPRLHFPEYKFTMKSVGSGQRSLKIFDKIRLKFVSLTPEEWVRQHVLTFLCEDRGYPKSLIGVEKELVFSRMSKRFDALVYNADHKPVMLIECKAPGVALDQRVFDQAARYNLVLQVPLFLLANGMELFCCRVNHLDGTYEFLPEVPDYQGLPR